MKKIISNAFENVPFGDLKYGLLGSVPAEILHVSVLYQVINLVLYCQF